MRYVDKIWFAHRLWFLKAAISTNAKSEIVLSGRGRHLDKAIWRPNRSITISGFAFADIAAFRRSKSMSKPNFVDIDGWDITFRFWKTNVRHTGNLLSVSTICPKYAHYSATGYRISSNSKHPLRKYDVISISQDGGCDGWILLPVSYLLMSLPSEGQSLLANEILTRYLKWRLRYIFCGNKKWLGKGSKKISKSRMCQYPGMYCYILFIQKCIFDACRQRLHNSGLICNQATALSLK